MNMLWAFIAIIVAFFMLTQGTSLYVWCIVAFMGTALAIIYGNSIILQTLLIILTATLIFLSIKPFRQRFISKHIFKLIRKKMPAMSSTERDALEAGTVSFEGDLFSGLPNFTALLETPAVPLTPKEQAFMEGPVHTLCSMLDDWDITHNRADLPPEIWQFIKENRFLGMIIPENYGGLGFSATAQMSVLVKVYGRSITAATTISVPNSLGPSELLLKYGTESQKSWYLPRLADGREIPCFALTAPEAGSDAASITDSGVVGYKEIQGQKVLGLTLNWNKRYITLCPVATVIGLAFRMYDPDNILDKGVDLGITCALIPADTPGITKGRRHFPLNAAFLNGPTQGKDVFVPMDSLIGGAERAGQGWRMLMECLSAGRAISLPSSASGGAQVAAMVSGAYARIRKQFNQPIAKFEGIEEPLARIAGNTYMIDAALTMAAAAIDQGAKPSVAGAILKYHCTEKGRQIALDAMDIHGGKGICMGPRNYLGRGYQNAPIGITVEGANILTRSLIIFGQGVIRCHPFIFQEMESCRNGDMNAFDTAFFAHAGFILTNTARSLLFTWTDAYGSYAPHSSVSRYYQLINKFSANLAFLADFSMLIMGGGLKRREKISARLGDMLSSLYFVSAVLKRFHQDGEPPEDLPIVVWCCQRLFHDCDVALMGVISNFPGMLSRIILRTILKPLGHIRPGPGDDAGRMLAHILTTPNAARDRLTRLAFKESWPACPAGQVEEAFLKITAVEPLEKRMQAAIKTGKLTSQSSEDRLQEAVNIALITTAEAEAILEAERARAAIIAVDDFTDEELRRVKREKND